MIIGLGGAALALAVAWALAVFISFGCYGSDVSEASGSALCADPIPEIVAWGGLFGAPGAPLLGMIVALAIRRGRPLVVGGVASVAVLLVMAVFRGLAA
jgi:hypothetical protein